ncbi:hypothetical protein EE612_049993 [Oryza sativa]|nr:hypothetical protein EE612_049993 [Oryza sativa]
MFVGFVFVMSSIRTTPKLYTSLFGVRRPSHANVGSM